MNYIRINNMIFKIIISLDLLLVACQNKAINKSSPQKATIKLRKTPYSLLNRYRKNIWQN